MDNGSNATLNVYPNVEAIAEFKVLTSNYGAQYGRNGSGTIEVETKSGGKTFHGSAFEYLRNDIFNARSWEQGRDRDRAWLVRAAAGARRRRGSGHAVAAPLPSGRSPLPQRSAEAAYLRSPQVGTFYLSAEPHGEPFIHEGSAVEPGQVIGLIEAMKLINEVEAEAGGMVQRVLVDDGQPVEYGQPLFELE